MAQITIQQKEKEKAQIEAQIEEEKIKQKELDFLLSAGGDKSYIEKMAREKLGYISPNERVFIDISGK